MTAPPRAVWHLLWALPLSCTAALAAWFVADFALCGVSGCSGGGFGVTDSVRFLTPPFLVAGAVLAPVPLAVVPWAHRRRRMLVAAGAALVLLVLVSARAWWVLAGAAEPLG